MNLRAHVITLSVWVTIVAPGSNGAFAQPCELGWDPSIGNQWFSMPLPNGNSPGTRAFAVFDDGTGPALYSGGARNPDTDGAVTKWTGNSWEVVGGGVDLSPQAHVLLVFDDGTGPALYAGGSFTTAGGAPANSIAKWDGSSWSALGGGLTNGYYQTIVFALAAYDDGGGPALYATGRFELADGIPVRHIAKWDGTSWSDVGGGLDGMYYLDRANALAVFDDGSGEALYVGGVLDGAGGVTSPGIVKWDGESWSAVGGGVGTSYPTVRALRVFDDGTGPALYVGGTFCFHSPDEDLLNRIAKWDGSSWSPLGSGLPRWVASLEVFDDGTGPALYAGGKFNESDPGGTEGMNYIAKWNGTTWEPLGTGTNGNVYFMEVFDDGYGPDLYVSGGFSEAGGMTTHTIARWGCSPAFLALAADPPTCPGLGETLTVTLHMFRLGTFEASGFQAYLSFDDSILSFVSGAYTPEPFGLHLIDPITADGGNIDLAASIDKVAGQTPTSADADLATLVFEVVGEDCAGTTVSFRPHAPATHLLNIDGEEPPYGLVSLDSSSILIDDTPPTITYCPPDIMVLVNPGEESTSVDPGTATGSDNCDVSVLGTRSDGLALTDPYPVHTTITITWTAEDACGHIAECEQHVAVGVQGILHVDVDAPGGGDGTSWATPFDDLQEALSVIGSEHEIRVAQGTYTPDLGSGDRTASFRLMNGVAICGGYAGWGECDPDLRDIDLFTTILSGDLDHNDTGTSGHEENSYQVVVASDTDDTAVLDGFTIMGGNADGPSTYDRGAGIYNEGASPTVANCAFSDNSANYGSGLYNINGSPMLTHCTFSANSAVDTGGGMVNEAGSPALANCTFSSNSANCGGGLYSTGDTPTLTHCTFSGNSAADSGGGIYNQAGSLVVANCAFSGNSASYGGGLYNSGDTPTLANCTFSANSAVDAGGGMVNYDSSPALSNCILWGNIDNDGMDESAQIHADGPDPIVNYCCIQGWTGGWGGTGNLGDDPLLTDPDGADNVPGTGDDDLHLQPGSPCIDAGDNDAVPQDDQLDLDGDCDTGERMPIDLDGNERFADDPATEPDPGHGDKPVVDIGAYEFGSTPPPLDDCNNNGVPDLCDIDSGTSPDDNANGIPDECEPCLEPGDSGRHCTADICPNNHDGVWDYSDDGDCVVNLWDLAQLLGNYGMTSGATREDGDICPPPDGDGAVGIGDLAEMLGQYGDNCN